jgi:hypothetical protein
MILERSSSIFEKSGFVTIHIKVAAELLEMCGLKEGRDALEACGADTSTSAPAPAPASSSAADARHHFISDKVCSSP